MTAVIKKMASGFTKEKAMAEPTVSAGYLKELLDFAVSKGASKAHHP